MTDLLQYWLPKEIVDIVKLYTGEGWWRSGKYINIHRIPQNDFRYAILTKRPRIKLLCYDSSNTALMGSVWFKLHTGKFVVLNLKEKKTGNFIYYIWEMHYNQEVIQFIKR
jgi:hypothetical protein